MSLAERGALVTGGGRGIGAAAARALADGGARLVVAARSAPEIESVAEEIRTGGGEAWAVSCDVTEPVQVEALFAEAVERLGAVDILVNNAGAASAAPLARLELEEWTRLWMVNATGTFLCTKAAVPAMLDAGWGRVVNVASVASLRGARYISAYAAAKHAVLGFTRSVAAEVARGGITVNAVCPGYVDTPMTAGSIANIVEKTGIREEEALDALLETSPQRRLIEPGEVASAVVFLCGEEARSINGQTLVLDGGALASH